MSSPVKQDSDSELKSFQDEFDDLSVNEAVVINSTIVYESTMVSEMIQ